MAPGMTRAEGGHMLSWRPPPRSWRSVRSRERGTRPLLEFGALREILKSLIARSTIGVPNNFRVLDRLGQRGMVIWHYSAARPKCCVARRRQIWEIAEMQVKPRASY